MEKKSEYKELINELNKLSEDFPATKDRMVEIAKILLTEHFNYYRKSHEMYEVLRKNNQNE